MSASRSIKPGNRFTRPKLCPTAAAIRSRTFSPLIPPVTARSGRCSWSACPPRAFLHAHKGYGADALRWRVEPNGTLPNSPPKANWVWKNCFSLVLYRARNASEPMFCRLKDFPWIATRHERPAARSLAGPASPPPSSAHDEAEP